MIRNGSFHLLAVLLILSVSIFPAGAPATDQFVSTIAAARIKLNVSEPAVGSVLAGHGGRKLADYGSFQLWELPAEHFGDIANLTGVTARAGDDTIELNAGAIRTARDIVQVAVRAPEIFPGKRLHLIQFIGPIKPDWHAALTNQGWRIVSYIPRNTYLVYGSAESVSRLRASRQTSPHIQWESDYRAEHKIHPRAQQAADRAMANQPADDLFAVQLVEDPDGNTGTLQLLDEIRRAWVRRTAQLGYVNCILRLPPERLAEVAGRPDVVSIQTYQVPRKQDERQDQILAGNLTGTQPSGPGYLAWLAAKGFALEQFASSGFVVDVTDSGFDNGTQSPGHFGLYSLGDRNLSSRVVYNRLVGTPSLGSTIQGCDGHGNLNAHIIAGYSDLSGFPHADSSGYRYGLGVCPYARLGSSVIFDPDTFTFPNFNELQSRAYQDGARISCNSWGADLNGAYNIDCQNYDALVRDAQPAGSPFSNVGNQEMVIVFSAGNVGPGANTVSAPGSAKNILSVGAAENVRSHSAANGGNDAAGDDGCNTPDSGADSAGDIIDFSGRGPCDDGRIKPDLVAPGTHVTGGVGQEASPGPTGTALACYRASGICALTGSGAAGNPNNFFPLGQEFFTTSSGTSHACPAVGGGAALLRQYFLNQGWTASSPAMTKAWLMNSSRYLDGVGANDTLPSNSQGMGSMNLGTAFDGVPRVRRDQMAADRFTATGQSRTLNGFVFDPGKRFRVTLAWTDAPGSTAGNAYNNDLDLTVTIGGQTFRGNVFSGELSAPGGSSDTRNNVESIFLPDGVGGPFTVTVTAANINSDGVPNNADALDQDFALVICNASDRDVLLVPAGGSLLAESCTSQGAIDPGETVTVNLALQNTGPSNTTSLVATLLPGNGVTLPGAPQDYGVLLGNGGSAVSRPFTFTASGECGGSLLCKLQLQDGTNNYGTVDFSFPLGLLATNQLPLSNYSIMAISATNESASLYPSAIGINGVVGRIQTATVTVHGLSHTWPDDLDVVLVGPGGQAAMLLSDVGGGTGATNLTLTFDSSASNGLPDDAPLTSGTWRPTDFEADTAFPAPAPPGPYGTSLSVFAGGDPNGAWQLFVRDDYASDDGGEIFGGWTLTLTTTNTGCCLNPLSADLTIHAADFPDPVNVSNVVSYTINVTNRGPAISTDPTLVTILSSNVLFLAAAPSQGSYTQSAETVTCQFGPLPPGGNASLVISALVTAGPQLVTTAGIAAAAPDPNLSNNQATVITTVVVPLLTIQDASVIEGDAGNTFAVCLAVLSQPATQTIQVDYQTASGTAQTGPDYLGQTNRLVFAPGEIARTIAVAVVGDTLDEDDETFTVILTNPLNVTLTHAQAVCTIVDDDPVPGISISDTAVVEGNAGTTNAVFSVSLSAPSGRTVSVSCSTSNGTALAGQDYVALLNRTLAFAPGQTTSNVAVTINGDTQIETDEMFSVILSSPTNALLARRQGAGAIISDDLAPLIVSPGYRIVAESGTNDGVIEAGETVTISLALLNSGSADTTNLVATLQAAGGVGSPSGPQSYGALLAGGPQTSRPFTFTAGISNCGTLMLQFVFADGGSALGKASFSVNIGDCFVDDFEPDIDLPQWSAFGGIVGSTVLATNFGGSVSSPNALWFGGGGFRFADSRPINTTDGGLIRFHLRLASGASNTWENVDLPNEGVVLEYSTNAGGLWTEVARYDTALYQNWTAVSLPVPADARQPATQFRWRQLSNSGLGFDHWALDNVQVLTGPQPPAIFTQPTNQSVPVGGTATFAISASGTEPLSYQWRSYETNLDGATNAALALSNVQSNQAGPYSVSVSNAYGSLTSSVAMLSVLPPGSGVAYLRSTVGQPWSTTTNEGLMDRVFGAGNWQDLRFETANAAALFTPANGFIFMDGSDTGASEMETFLNANRAQLESWVGNGGRVFLNSAPNEDNGMYLGFGANLVYSDLTEEGRVAAPSHPIFIGPFQPVGISWTAISFAHATVTGTNLATLITNSVNGHIVLAEQAYGSGRAMFGGMSTPNFHNPPAEAANLRANILAYASIAVVTNLPPQIVSQPRSRTAAVGGNCSFTAGILGSAPFTYQWRFNETNLPGATAASLTLTNLTISQAGLYSLAVTNPFGYVISSNATLMVTTNLPIVVGLSAPGDTNEFSALGGTLTNLGFTVRVVGQGQWNGLNVVMAYPGDITSSFGPSRAEISNAVNFVQISDWGSDWTPNSFLSLSDNALITIRPDTAHEITTGLPASWTAYGFWRYGIVGNDYVGWSSDAALPSLASTISGVSQSRLLVADSPGNGRAVYIGWNVYGPDAGPHDLAILRNAIQWAAGPLPIPQPAIGFQTPTLLSDGTLTLWLGHTDGSPITAGEAARTRILSAGDVTLPLANWQPLPNPVVLTNGLLRVDGLNVSNSSSLFFRAEQAP